MVSVGLLDAFGGNAFDTESVLRQAGVAPAKFEDWELLSRALYRHHFDAIVFVIGDRDDQWRARLEKVRSQLLPMTWLLVVGRGRELAVCALEAGADDYLCHPLEVDIVRSRLAAALRRQHKLFNGQRTISCGPYLLDIPTHTLRLEKSSVPLTSREAALLALFFNNPGATIPRVDLAHSSGIVESVTSHAIEQQMYQLRRKLRRVAPRLVLSSSYGRGYVLHVTAEDQGRRTRTAGTAPSDASRSPSERM
ncbi:response regulator transcription factor [Ramlibacter tataouinensis]|uniref:Candidate response regulator, OmpR n=1 Tax=Ramlibacter tataouinensis (strain ATCC BAA-407 / DSM 14655 / LMG 21543 / TTB310) TaxID=365046 RepID=F5Y6J1_RAMTT|nr:winged helix-turn-helix domain-containing protein [Ramlibacter tataouinensis]AEG94065.1 Candidate response regulator, OmpR [Ramlibacter tataouinensis TTB310]